MNRIDFLRTMGVTALGIGIGIPGLTQGMSVTTGEILPDLLLNAKGKTIHSVKKWNKEREVIKKRWLDYLGALKPNPTTPVLKVLNEEKQNGIIRQYVEYEGEPGIMVRGYLLKPETLQQALPGVVALHSTSDTQMLYISGAEKGKIVPFGYELAQQGFVVFCPQCYLWHENEGRNWEEQASHYIKNHPGMRGMGKMLFDAQRAVDVLESLEEVDASRIGCMGHSLGAKEAFYLGAFDDRVGAIVSNEGGIGIEMSNWDAIWYLGEEIGAFGHEHHEVLALAAPKPFLLIGGDSADGKHSSPYIEAVKPVYDLYGKKENLELRNHGQGHSAVPITQEWTYNWMKEHL